MSYFLTGVVIPNTVDLESEIEKQIESYSLNYKVNNSYNLDGEYDFYEIGFKTNIIPKKNNLYTNLCKIKDIDCNKKINIKALVYDKQWININDMNQFKSKINDIQGDNYLVILRCHI